MDQSVQQSQTLCIKHLAKNYSKRWVVKDVSFTMQSGQIVGLLGPNGAGKTTSFYMVVGLVRMDKGEIHLDNLDLSDLALTGTKDYALDLTIMILHYMKDAS